ncbi:uncharacterized protein V1518DRAFT_418089 [Limtongia smithiae]|uniref:uncharacterized protein n=1 Tax=Limtongia smithiae TaxID=1125753 RepID=UPI0034CEB1FB
MPSQQQLQQLQQQQQQQQLQQHQRQQMPPMMQQVPMGQQMQMVQQARMGQQAPLTQLQQLAKQRPPPARATVWTKSEEDRLRVLVELGTKWQAITKEFPNRTAGAIKKHYYADMKHTTWNTEEDERLIEAVKEDAESKWRRIAERVGKPAKACEKRTKELAKVAPHNPAPPPST